MEEVGARAKTEVAAYGCLLLSAFLTPFSLPSGRVALALGLVLLIVHGIRTRRAPVVPPVAWAGLVFIVIAVVVTVFGVDPALGVPKLRKLMWFVAMPVAATLLCTPSRFARFMLCFALGTTTLAVQTCIRNPIRAQAAVAAGRATDLAAAIIDQGSMTNAQRLMLGIVLCLAFGVLWRSRGRWMLAWWAVLAVQCAALIINFKRGSWLCTCLAVAGFAALRSRWRALLVLAAVIALSTLLPTVRARLAGLKDELQTDGGGRMTMWTRVAPVLVKRYPWGVGYRSLTNEMMRDIAPEVEASRDHLHSNILQVLVATGWLGLAAYLAWMVRAVRDAWVFARRSAPGEQVLATALFLMLAALLANGLVEYNLGDSELVLPYAMIMGCAAAGCRRLRVAEPTCRGSA